MPDSDELTAHQEAIADLLAPDKPSVRQLREWMSDGGCETPDGCWTEPDGQYEHGLDSWLLRLGLI